MATKNILDYQGNIIGQLTLEDDATEIDWSNALSSYAEPPKSLKLVIVGKLKDYKKASADLIDELKADNTLAGITVAQSAKMFDDFADVLLMLREGAFPTALYRLSQKQPIGFVSQEMLDSWIAKIKAAL